MGYWVLNAILGLIVLVLVYQIFFYHTKTRLGRHSWLMGQIIAFLIFFMSFSLVSYLLLDNGATSRDIRYNILLSSPFANSDLRDEPIVALAARLPASVTVPQVLRVLPESGYQLVIPKISVSAPIIISSGPSNKSMLESLESGVGLYPSVLPGVPGRAVILGHSSRASWYKGNYAHVFSLLPRLAVGDAVAVNYRGTVYRYQVFATQVLNRDDANRLLSAPTDQSELALITCYPIGSAAQRIVVQARLIGTETGPEVGP
ncbi:MAG: sortase [Candidatus Liptonbacteria bacterium]|nr:sortase [Candidatus Liptonbacteria bacterium]